MSELRERYLAAIADHDSTSEPDAELIWGAVSGELPPERRREVVDRVAADPAWAEAWRLAWEIWSSTEEGRRALDRPGAPRGFWRHYGALAAAASVVLVVGAALFIQRVLAPEPEFRNQQGPRIESLVSESEPLPREDVVLAWTPGAAGATYEITVTTESLAPVATADRLDEPRYRVPASALQEIPAGGRLLWRVRARAPDGTELRSPTFVTLVQ